MRGTVKRGRGRGAATRRKAAATSSEIDVTKETSADDKVITVTGNDEELEDGDKPMTDDADQELDEMDVAKEMEAKTADVNAFEKEDDLSVTLDVDPTEEDCETTHETKQESAAEDLIEVKVNTSEPDIAPDSSDLEFPETPTNDVEGAGSNKTSDMQDLEPAIVSQSSPVQAGTPALDQANLIGDDQNTETNLSISKEDLPLKMNSNEEKPIAGGEEPTKAEKSNTEEDSSTKADVKVDETEQDKETEEQASKKDANVILSPIVSKATEKDERPFPASLARMRQLKVNIGPIKQCDLKSEKLHEVLRLNDTFEIKFELRDKKCSDGSVIPQKTGFVRIPFEIRTPNFLIRVADILGNLHIDGKNMSVTFPDAFNKALDDCKEYMATTRKIRAEKTELKKRQIVVKNVPPNVTEETIRSLFPEATKVTLSVEESTEGEKKVGGVLLEYKTEGACVKCLETNKDVFIEDCQLKIYRLVSGPKQNSNRGFGRGRGSFSRVSRGVHHAMKIKARAGIGSFRNLTRGQFRGSLRGRGSVSVTRGRGTTNFANRALGTRSKAPGSFQSSGQTAGGTGSPKASFSGSRGAGHSFSRGQFATTFRNVRKASIHSARGRGSSSLRNESSTFRSASSSISPFRQPVSGTSYREGKSYKNEISYRATPVKQESRISPLFREPSPRQSSYRDNRPSRSPAGNFRTGSQKDERRFSPGRSHQSSSSKEEDPMAMMAYLKSTLERMEEKFSQSGSSDRGHERYDENPSKRSQFSPRGRGRGRGTSPQGRGRGRGGYKESRKRSAGDREFSHEAKRPYLFDDRDNRETYSYSSSQDYSSGTSSRRESVGQGGGRESYQQGRSYGNQDYKYRSSGNRDRKQHFERSSQNFGYSSTSEYGDSSGSYGQSRSDNSGQFISGKYNQGSSDHYGQDYSDGSYSSRGIIQYSSSGGGRGGISKGRGQSSRDQRW